MFIIINGTLGVGKTSVSWELTSMFEKAVMLDGDYLGAVHPFHIYSEERIAHLYDSIAHLAAFHQQAGYKNFVVNYIFENGETLSDLYHRLRKIDPIIYVYHLLCDLDVLTERVARRKRGKVTWELDRYKKLVDIQAAAAKTADLGYPIDTTNQTILEVARTIWEDSHEPIKLIPHQPEWAEAFRQEAEIIKQTIGDQIEEVYHIGSTAVPELPAKPIIDMIATIPNLADVERCIFPLRDIGYHYSAFPPTEERIFFRKGQPRTHQLHIVEANSQALYDRLRFRDILRESEQARQAYLARKNELADRFPYARSHYSNGKGDLIYQTLNEHVQP